MIDYQSILSYEPYSMDRHTKRQFLTYNLIELTRHHIENCEAYKRICSASQMDVDAIKSYEDIPALPVRLFKEYDLISVPRESIIKTMTSSGTTGQNVSKIYLDRGTSANQTKTLTKIVSAFIGNKRLPMLILDSPSVLRDRNSFSARGAGILGFSIFAKDKCYAFQDDMEIDYTSIRAFLERYSNEPILLFGFTFMIWQYFYKKLKQSSEKLDLSNGILIHGGGWKKLAEESVASAQYKKALGDVCGIKRIFDYYGMVEQTGSIYMECEYGHLHTSIFSDIVIRNATDLSVLPTGRSGLIETVSLIPYSYPGHCLLTEDEGILLGEDDCPCGRPGKYFKVLGRIRNAEIRGCSDTYVPK